MFPTGLVSLGKTISVIMVRDSFGVFDSIKKIFAKIPKLGKREWKKEQRKRILKN
jgi:hypothetical protein